jgi:hypothetical protein
MVVNPRGWDDTRRVWSLWDIMNTFDLSEITYEMSILGGIEAAYRDTMIKGESMPDPAKDDSFAPFMSDKNFTQFLRELR